MAENRAEFDARLAALGDLVSRDRVELVARECLRSIKAVLGKKDAEAFAALLPRWLRAEWDGLDPGPPAPGPASLVDTLRECGKYPYRAAAERDLTAFFATLRESLAEGGALGIRPLLPEADRELFDYAASCAYDASVREFV